jgi:vacuolar-type H+-ATPase subunit I/STV1
MRFHVKPEPDILEQLRAGLKLESLAVNISNPVLVEAAKEAVDKIEQLREEVETWKSRYEAERKDHEATIKVWEEERSGL